MSEEDTKIDIRDTKGKMLGYYVLERNKSTDPLSGDAIIDIFNTEKTWLAGLNVFYKDDIPLQRHRYAPIETIILTTRGILDGKRLAQGNMRPIPTEDFDLTMEPKFAGKLPVLRSKISKTHRIFYFVKWRINSIKWDNHKVPECRITLPSSPEPALCPAAAPLT